MRCGLFPVLCSCSMTETTTSSLMPSVSIVFGPITSPGDGGGVTASGRCWGLSMVAGDSRGEDSGDGLSYSLLTFFEGGCSIVSAGGDGLELER